MLGETLLTPDARCATSYSRAAVGERPCVSAVVPCFNEAHRLAATLSTLTATLDALVPDGWEIIVVDDSSTDDTRAVAQRWPDRRVRVTTAKRGKGKGAAVRTGLLAAEGDFVFVTDADLAGEPGQLAALLDGIGDSAAAVGTRVLAGSVIDPPRPLRRRLAAAMFRTFAHRVGGVAVSDPQCGFKLFRRDAVTPHAATLVTEGYAYEVELLLRLQRAAADVVEVPIHWSEGAESNIHVAADGIRMVREVVAARRSVRATASAPPPSEPGPRLALSVVMPVYNEAPVIDTVVKDVRHLVLDVAEQDGGEAELVIVDDRGTDGSSAIVAALADEDQRIRVIVNPRNRGHGPSVRRGLDAARGEWLLQLDSDGQLDLADFAAMWARRGDADLVIGMRTRRQDPRHRLVLTWVVNALVSAMVRRRVCDANAGFKLISADLYRHLRPSIPHDTFAPSLLLVVGAHRAGARTVSVPVAHRSRPAGASSLHAGRLARAILTATRQTVCYAVTRVPAYRR